MPDLLDLRSDTVTRPTVAMRKAMAAADVGDDVYGEDPTVNRLEAVAAERLGQEAGLFVSSGTQGNLCAVLAHCERGDEYLVGHDAHTYRYEGGGAAVLGSVQPQPLPFEPDGSIDLERAAAAIKPDDSHFARTRLFCLENTWHGRIVPQAYLDRAAAFAREHGLGFHLDGARVFNAAVAQSLAVSEVTARFDSVSFCLSKGLGAPVGSVLVGHSDLIDRARRWRKVLGGGMRQAGVLAAAGLHALEHHVERLAEDHALAAEIATGLGALEGLDVDYGGSNMVFVRLRRGLGPVIARRLEAAGVRVNANATLRLVTHLDLPRETAPRVTEAFRRALEAAT
jgi:threonine aldolase